MRVQDDERNSEELQSEDFQIEEPTIVLPVNEKILIVENSAAQREALKKLLLASGYRCEAVAHGKGALDRLPHFLPDLVISDSSMPEMDGFSLCERIKSEEAHSQIPVILMTSLSDPKDILHGLQAGADSFIRKPYEPNYLLARIRFLIDNRKLRSSERVKFGLEVLLFGKRHTISYDREQIFDLLISTFEEAVLANEELKAQGEQLAHSYRILESLHSITEKLIQSLDEKTIAKETMARVVRLPGISAGWLMRVYGKEKTLLSVEGLPMKIEIEHLLRGECSCYRRAMRGERIWPIPAFSPCELLQTPILSKFGFQFHLPILLPMGDQPLGTLNVMGARPEKLGEDELRLLRSVSSQVAIALAKAYLHHNLEREVVRRTAALSEEVRERIDVERAVVHEINNLITVMMGNADLGGRKLPPDHPAHAFFTAISRIGKSAVKRIKDLLAVSGREALPAMGSVSPAARELPHETLLFVDDREEVRAVGAQLLREAGYAVVEASSGEEALDLLKQNRGRISLVITDIEMPGMSGFCLAERVLDFAPDMRILFVSGASVELKAGEDGLIPDFLAKPYTADTLFRKVREILDRPSEIKKAA